MTYKIIKRSEQTGDRLGFQGPFPNHPHRTEALRLLLPLPQAGNGRLGAAMGIQESPAHGSPTAPCHPDPHKRQASCPASCLSSGGLNSDTMHVMNRKKKSHIWISSC